MNYCPDFPTAFSYMCHIAKWLNIQLQKSQFVFISHPQPKLFVTFRTSNNNFPPSFLILSFTHWTILLGDGTREWK